MRTSLVILLALATAGFGARASQSSSSDDGWTREFHVEPGELASTGRNPYFILEPGYTLVLEGGTTRLVITVLNETRRIDNVDTRIVEERETEKDQPVEISRNFFAISTRSNSVFYFGEEVDTYKDGKISGHEGAWQSGANGAHFGLMMPGLPLLKARYYQEMAPKVAMDRAEIMSVTDTLTTPAGKFTNVLRTTESTPLELMSKEAKYYSAGIGLIQDGSLKLVKYGNGVTR